ncbi:AAA family ATPase [Serratia ureilytica]|uniref:AAA family ATPase n=1 Tax=Serratia ureilytica TaxID=300181 RepID=UPI0018D99EF4|nr:ATP-binding protein [Serratia ureilytica]MBH2618308.1 AAA family ATPase [Serratia ureilytica]
MKIIAYNEPKIHLENRIMHLTLESLKIKELFGHKNINLNFSPVTVIVGKNGLGKTTILKIINSILNQEDSKELMLCSSAELVFSNQQKIKFTNNKINSSKIKKNIEDVVRSEFLNKKEIKDKISKDLNIKLTTEDVQSLHKLITSMLVEEKINKIKQNKSSSFLYSDSIDKFLKTTSRIRYISTINMSANSQQHITRSDGKVGNFLDFEIQNEVSELVKLAKGKYTKLFIEEVNKLLLDSNKKIVINEDIYVYSTNLPKEKIELNCLSSGERQLIYIMATVANTNNSPTFLLMDEPEISLHLNWQERIIDSIKAINPNCQIIVVTHSPAIIMNGYMDSYIDMKDISEEMEK